MSKLIKNFNEFNKEEHINEYIGLFKGKKVDSNSDNSNSDNSDDEWKGNKRIVSGDVKKKRDEQISKLDILTSEVERMKNILEYKLKEPWSEEYLDTMMDFYDKLKRKNFDRPSLNK